MRQGGVPHRRHIRLLCLVPHDSLHDRSIYGHAIHGLRIDIESHEPYRTVRPLYTLLCGWTGRRGGGGANYAAGCYQDFIADKRECDRRRVKECLGLSAGRQNNSCKRWMEGIFPGSKASDNNDNAQHGHLLVRCYLFNRSYQIRSLTWH